MDENKLLDTEARIFNREDDKDAFVVLEALHKERGKKNIISNGSRILVNVLKSLKRDCECGDDDYGFPRTCVCNAERSNKRIDKVLTDFEKIIGGSLR